MRLLILTMLMIVAPAGAGEVYKCKGPNGEVTFTNMKCPEKSAAQHYGSYQATPDAPDPYLTPEESEVEAPLANPPMRTRTAATHERRTAGYECSAEGRTWIQQAPCPASSMRRRSAPVFGHNVVTGAPISGHVSVPVTVEVQQRELDRSALCDQLARKARTGEKGRDSDSAYTRNRMRDAHNCR